MTYKIIVTLQKKVFILWVFFVFFIALDVTITSKQQSESGHSNWALPGDYIQQERQKFYFYVERDLNLYHSYDYKDKQRKHRQVNCIKRL